MLAVMRDHIHGEFTTFIKVWILALMSLSYCYFAAKILPRGGARLSAFLPVAGFFLLAPLQLQSIFLLLNLSFLLSWLATFRLFMLAFDNGPLSDPSLSLPKFLAVACLPIKLKSQEGDTRHCEKRPKSLSNYAVKVVVLAMVVVTCRYYADHRRMYPEVVLNMYGLCIYLSLEIILAAVAAAATRSMAGMEMEPQFDEPYLSTSMQDFWGRRWNLTVSRIFHSAVYVPMRDLSAAVIGRRWAAQPAVMVTFAVSGLMHELTFFHFGCAMPTREVTWFFLLHGASVAIEIAVKKEVKFVRGWRLTRVAGVVLTHGFMLATSLRFMHPQFLWCKEHRTFSAGKRLQVLLMNYIS
ncbi:probable long-chain-alcohol O-fatty-acyltransferase 5 [Andrographis paniculata]|uniref:probable long-chain-alcohol O-fatty-acyltransferase 5 n=1 Tax=Andrographis paniculata TaxID=175694 RepID=UPI0021E95DC8|nr:probable long-chain-alcohol O-fatty-acyltransferase 5 [Andrographis paniculata]